MTTAPLTSAIRWTQPIRRNLPLLISALLITLVVAFGWLAERRVHAVVERAAEERLATAADRLASMLGESVVQMTRELRQLAAHADVVAAAGGTGGAARQAAALRALEARPPTATAQAQAPSRALWTRDCRLVGATGPLGDRATCPAAAAPTGARRGTMGVGPFHMRGDSIEYLLAAPVLAAAGDTIGFVSAARTLGGAGAAAIGGLIGEGTSLLVGNADGSLWTDLTRPVPGPATPLPTDATIDAVDADGVRRISIARPVRASPWLVLVGTPHTVIAAPARRLLAEMAVAAAICLVLGILGAWAIGRRVTRPIAEIAGAAAGIASGDYSQRVPVHRHD